MTSLIKFSFTQPNRDMGVVGEVREVRDLKHLYEMLRYECKLLVEETPKQNLSRFIPSIFTGNRRNTADFMQTQLLVLDVDDGDPSHFLMKMTDQKIGFILYETPSSTESQPKYRIIFETHKPITSSQQFKQVYKTLFDNEVQYDPACNDPARLFYIPNIQKLDTFFFSEGRPIQVPDVKEVVETVEDTTQDNMEAFFLESGEIVTLKLNKIITYLIDHNLTITATHKTWLAVCFACVSLRNHNLSKTACLEYFISLSNLDKEKCESQEKLIEKFEYCWKHTHNNYSIGTIYYYAKEVGCPLPKINSEIIKLVRVPETKNFNLALNNTESDDIVPLHHDVQDASISREKIIVAQADIFSLKTNDVITFRENQNTGELKEVFLDSISRFVAKHETQPQQTVYLLGHNKQGTFYEKSTKSILIANHYRVPCKAVFHQDIHDFLCQIHIPTNFLYTYLYYFTNMEVALPILNLWGESDAGKSLFVKLVASVFSNPPIEDYITESSFKDTAGTSPVIFFDEAVPNSPSELKAIVTSNYVSINQKYKGKMYVKGYSRILCAVNSSRYIFPSSTTADVGAIIRRVQPIPFTQDNVNYLKNIGGIDVTKHWVATKFREHLKYVQENPEKFNLIPKGHDILALSPIKAEEITVFNAEHRTIIQYFYGNICHIIPNHKECIVIIKALFEDLLKSRVILKRMDDDDLLAILRQPLPKELKTTIKMDFKKGGEGSQINIKRIRVKTETVEYVLRTLKLDIDIEKE